MRLLSLDPGITTGFAFFERNDGKVSLESFGQIPKLSDDLFFDAWAWLDEHARDVDEVAIEGPLTALGVRTIVEVHEMRGSLYTWCSANTKPFWLYHPSTVKAAVTGTAGATKTIVARSAGRAFNIAKFPSDHASDAVAIGMTHFIKQYGDRLGDRVGAQTKTGAQDHATYGRYLGRPRAPEAPKQTATRARGKARADRDRQLPRRPRARG